MDDHTTNAVSSILHVRAQTGTRPNASLVEPTETSRRFCFYDCYIILVKHHSGIAGERRHLRLQRYNISTHEEVKYARLQFNSNDRLWFSLNCNESIQARRTVWYIHTHMCILSACTHMHKQTFGWLLHLGARQISLFLIQECVRGQPVQNISHTVCTTIYIIYINTQKNCSNSSQRSQLQRRAHSGKHKKLRKTFFPSRDSKHINMSTTSWFKGFSRIYRERKSDGHLHISSMKEDKDWNFRQGLIVVFAAGPLQPVTVPLFCQAQRFKTRLMKCHQQSIKHTVNETSGSQLKLTSSYIYISESYRLC